MYFLAAASAFSCPSFGIRSLETSGSDPVQKSISVFEAKYVAFWEDRFPVAVQQPPEMVAVGVGQHDARHLRRFDAGSGKTFPNLPEGRPVETSGARVDEDQFPADLQQQGVHVQIEPVGREEGGPQRPFQLLLRRLGRPGRLDRLEAQAPRR